MSVRIHRRKPALTVAFRGSVSRRLRVYPLTRAGCLRAGEDLFKSGAEVWLNSSSVDFPQEVKPRCRLDVRTLMSKGFLAALDRAAKR